MPIRKHWPISFSTCGRRIVAGLLVLLVGVGAIGFPLIPVVRKDVTIPFPCQDSPCACRDAESCWRNCCCKTHQQKLAWSIRNNVEPPPFFLELVASEMAGDLREPSSCCGAEPSADDSDKHNPDAKRVTFTSPIFLSAQSDCSGISPIVLILTSALPWHDFKWSLDRATVPGTLPKFHFLGHERPRPPSPPPR